MTRTLFLSLIGLDAYDKVRETGPNPPAPKQFRTKEIDATARNVVTMTEVLCAKETTIRLPTGLSGEYQK